MVNRVDSFINQATQSYRQGRLADISAGQGREVSLSRASSNRERLQRAGETLREFSNSIKQEYGEAFYQRLPQKYRRYLETEENQRSDKSARWVVHKLGPKIRELKAKTDNAQRAQDALQRAGSQAYALKNLSVKATAVTKQTDAANTTIIGGLKIVGTKDKGVEPGFTARKIWTAKDTEKMLASITGDTKKDRYADTACKFLIGSSDYLSNEELVHRLRDAVDGEDLELPQAQPEDQNGQRPAQAQADQSAQLAFRERVRGLLSQEALTQETFDELRDLIKNGPDPKIRERIVAPERADARTDSESGKRILNALKEHLMEVEEKFKRNHYVKLDYHEKIAPVRWISAIRTAVGARPYERYTTAPHVNISAPKPLKGLYMAIHRFARSGSPAEHNRDAVKEALANELTRSFGVTTQKLKLIESRYESGEPKLLLDGTHMYSPNDPDAKYQDLDESVAGQANNKVIVKTQINAVEGPDGKMREIREKIKNERGHYDVEPGMQQFGRNKIFFMLLADRDAVGSKGQNKGRIGNEFAAIDPGKSLDVSRMKKRDIHSDFSIEGKEYKNFSIFDQTPYSERMQGVKWLADNKNNRSQLFEQFSAQFGGVRPGLDFSSDIQEWQREYAARYDHILEVFRDRLDVYKYQGVSDQDQNSILDTLDTLEKLTSKATWKLEGDSRDPTPVDLKIPVVKNSDRVKWTVVEDGDSITFKCLNRSSTAQKKLDKFSSWVADKAKNDPKGYDATMQNGTLQVKVKKSDLSKACSYLQMDMLKQYTDSRP